MKEKKQMKNVDAALIEFANDAFYIAFNTRNMKQMADLWSVDTNCVCIHPGWQPVFGRSDILDTWESIFSGQSQDNQIICHAPRVLDQGEIYSVICFEQLPAGWLTATNNFVIEAGAAKLIHHQAGQCMEPPELTVKTRNLQ